MKYKNAPLIVAIALPILFTIIISLVVFIPQYLINPQYNFLYSVKNIQYSSGVDSLGDSYIIVKDTRIATSTVQSMSSSTNKSVENIPTLYLYDVKTDTAHKISVADAQALVVKPGPTSPDGYIVKYEYGNGGFFNLFDGSAANNSGFYIEKDNTRKKLPGVVGNDGTPSYYQPDYIDIIGWIK